MPGMDWDHRPLRPGGGLRYHLPMKKTFLLTLSLLMVGGYASAQSQTQKPVDSPATRAVVDSLVKQAAIAAKASGKAPEQAAKGQSSIFDGLPAQAPTQSPIQTLPKKKDASSKAKDDGIVYPDDPPKKDGDNGGDNPSPEDQLKKILVDVMKSKEVREGIDQLREDQTNKIFSPKVKAGIAVAGAGLATAGVGLIIGASAVTGIGLAVVGAVLLGAVIFSLFGGKKKKE